MTPSEWTLTPSLYDDFHRIGYLTIHGQGYVHFAAPGQAARQPQVHLIQPDQIALRPCVEHFRASAADLGADSRKRAASKNSRAEEQKKDLVIARQVNRNGDDLVLRSVEASDGLVDLSSFGFDPHRHCGGKTLPGGVGGEERRRDLLHFQHAAREKLVAVVNINQRSPQRQIFRHLKIDLPRRNEKQRRAKASIADDDHIHLRSAQQFRQRQRLCCFRPRRKFLPEDRGDAARRDCSRVAGRRDSSQIASALTELNRFASDDDFGGAEWPFIGADVESRIAVTIREHLFAAVAKPIVIHHNIPRAAWASDDTDCPRRVAGGGDIYDI